ncbi:MAG: VOC family protein [Bacteroidia bacterium]|nr:VOC family protein [Bacteroidia bacterium]
MKLNPYLSFNGNCREAMTFYKECTGGELILNPYDDSPMAVPDEEKDKIMHSSLVIDGLTLMAADSLQGQPVTNGNNISLSISCISKEQANEIYNKLSEGGLAIMPMETTFWGAYFGMLTDKFGINWMISCEGSQDMK